MALADDIAKGLAAELKGAKTRAERSEIISSYQALNGCSRNTVLRAARKSGWKSGRKSRSDKGKSKANLTEEQITKLVKMRMGTRDKKYKIPRLPYWCMLQMAEDQGIIPKRKISVAQLSRLFREMGLGMRDLKLKKDQGDPIKMKSKYPNDCWFIDTTICAQWYLNIDGKFKYQSLEDYKNKEEPGVGKPKLIRFLIVDKASGAFYVRYYTKENIRNMTDFLWRAFSPKPDMNLEPMRGLPKILFGDKGSVNRAGPIQNLLKRLKIEWRDHMVGNPRAKGTVEVMMDKWQRWFETRLMLQKAKTLEELNEWATSIRQLINFTRIMDRHGMTRAMAWNIIPEQRLVLPPDYEIFQKLLQATTVKRLVHPGRIIRFEGEEYQLGGQKSTKEQLALVGEKIEVGRSPWKWEEANRVIEVITPDGVIYEIEPMRANILEFPMEAAEVGKEFKKSPETKAQKQLKRRGVVDGRGQAVPMEEIARGFQGNMFYVNKERFPDIALMPRKGSPMVIETSERRMPRLKGLEELEQLLKRKLNPAESQTILVQMDKEVSDRKIRQIAEEIKRGIINVAIKEDIRR